MGLHKEFYVVSSFIRKSITAYTTKKGTILSFSHRLLSITAVRLGEQPFSLTLYLCCKYPSYEMAKRLFMFFYVQLK